MWQGARAPAPAPPPAVWALWGSGRLWLPVLPGAGSGTEASFPGTLGPAPGLTQPVGRQVQALTTLSGRAGGPEAHPGLHRAERRQLRGVFEAGAPGTTPGASGEIAGKTPEGHFVMSVGDSSKGKGPQATSFVGTAGIPDTSVFTGFCILDTMLGVCEGRRVL